MADAFDIILPQLDAPLTAAGGATSSEAVAIAVRKAGVLEKVTLLEEIKELISRRSDRISDNFGKKSAVYTELFLGGFTEYREINEGEVDANLDTIAAAKKHDPAMETEFKALKVSWVAAKSRPPVTKSPRPAPLAAVRTPPSPRSTMC